MLDCAESIQAIDTMRPSQALDRHRSQIVSLSARYRTANPRVFGSVLHGADREGSDLDLLVDAQPGATLFDLGALQGALEDLLEVRVDIRTPADLPERIRRHVLGEARPV